MMVKYQRQQPLLYLT